MSMSDCEKCWDTPCSCGWGYRNWPLSRRMKQAAVIIGLSDEDLSCMFENSIIPEDHPMKGKK